MTLRVSSLLLLLIPGFGNTQTYKFGFVLSKEDAYTETYQTIIGYAIDKFNKDSHITLVRRPLFPYYTFSMKLLNTNIRKFKNHY